MTEYIEREKTKWKRNGWQWNQAKVEANFIELGSNKDGVASGKERQDWFAAKKKSK